MNLDVQCVLFGAAMKPVPRRKQDEEDSIIDIKQNELDHTTGRACYVITYWAPCPSPPPTLRC